MRDVLKRVVLGQQSSRDTNRLVAEAHRRAVAQMRFLATHGYRIADGGEDVPDLAYDAVADLFARTADGRLVSLARSLSSQPESQTDVEAEDLFGRIVASRVTQFLSREFAFRDPVGAGLHRRLVRAVRRSEKLELVSYAGAEVVVLRRTSRADTDAQYPARSLLASSVGVGDDDAEAVLLKMLAISQRSGCRAAVRLSDAVWAWRSAMLSSRQPDEAFASGEPFISTKIDSAVAEVTKWLADGYAFKAGLTTTEADAFARSIRDFVDDLSVHGTPDSLWRYLAQHLPGLTRKEYRNRYRTRFEYVIAVTHRALASVFSR